MSDSVVAEILGGPEDGRLLQIPAEARDWRFFIPPPTTFIEQDAITACDIRQRVCPVIRGTRNGQVVYGIDWTNGVTR